MPRMMLLPNISTIDGLNVNNDDDVDDNNSNSNNIINGSDGSPDDYLSIIDGGNLTATISSIRSNVTRVLYMYFQNATDEFGYGAATTELASRTTTTTMSTIATTPTTTTIATTITPDINDGVIGGVQPTTAATTAAAAASTTMKATSHQIGRILNTAATFLQTHLLNGTTSAATATATATATIPPAAISNVTVLAATANATTATSIASVLTTAPSITYPSYRLAIRNLENCSALFANYTQPQQGVFCNWAWDTFLCWPPTPAGVLARMHCPSGWHGIDTKKFAHRKCELTGLWGTRPNGTLNDSANQNGWTDYTPCFKPEVNELMQKMTHLEVFLEIAKRTRTLEIVGLIISLLALILSLVIFCNFRSLRNNRTKIHKNLFIAMVLQVLVRLTLYLDQAFRRRGGNHETAMNKSTPGIENTPYLCEASYILLEYARTAMFMWMFIEGLYLHNMVTVAVFQGRFPHTIFSLLGWGVPAVMTIVWATFMAAYTEGEYDCWWNYNLTPYYWILEGPRLIVILLNFFFLMNIIRVLIVKLRQSQASDIEQTRKAVRAAIVLLPLLGITNLLHLVPALNTTPWKFALWSYVTHFLTSFQGFFIALIYCFLNGEVRAVLLKSLAVYMSVRGHHEWVPKRPSMFSGAYNTAPDTEGHNQADGKRSESPPNKRLNGRKHSSAAINTDHLNPRTHIRAKRLSSGSERHRFTANGVGHGSGRNWMWKLCFRGQKNKCVMSTKEIPTQIFMTAKMKPNF